MIDFSTELKQRCELALTRNEKTIAVNPFDLRQLVNELHFTREQVAELEDEVSRLQEDIEEERFTGGW